MELTAPAWLVEERLAVCAKCELVQTCKQKLQVRSSNVDCPLNKIEDAALAVTQRAFPANASRISGCCDPVGLGWGDS